MKSLLFCLILIFTLISCEERGTATIVFPSSSAMGDPFDYGAVIYAVNIDHPEFTRRIPFNHKDQEIEIDLIAGSYRFQAIAAYEATGLTFKCAKLPDPIFISDGSYHDINLNFSAANCWNEDVFINHFRLPSATVIGDVIKFNYCDNAGDLASASPNPTILWCTGAGVQSIKVDYVADGSPGISYCLVDSGDPTANYPMIIGNVGKPPEGLVFSTFVSVYSAANDCTGTVDKTFLFPNGFDAIPAIGPNFKMIVENDTTATLFLGLF